METTVIALSASDAKTFRSDEPYAIIQISDPGPERHPYMHPFPQLRAITQVRFDDILPEDAVGPNGLPRYVVMEPRHANAIAASIIGWWSRVATIIVHCHAGMSRSPGVAVAIREHYGQATDDLYSGGRIPNAHCKALVAAALADYDT